MKVLIIGCSNIGKNFINELSKQGHDIFIVDKNKKEIEKIKNEYNIKDYMTADIASLYNCKKVYNHFIKEDINIVINCSNLSNNKKFMNSSIDNDLDIIDLNIKAMHTITKLFLKIFIEKNSGYILNVTTNNSDILYESSKLYCLRLTQSIKEELNKIKSSVYIGYASIDDNTEVTKVIKEMFNKKNIIGLNKFKLYFDKLIPRNYYLKSLYKNR